jgi:hypothetical protein
MWMEDDAATSYPFPLDVGPRGFGDVTTWETYMGILESPIPLRTFMRLGCARKFGIALEIGWLV